MESITSRWKCHPLPSTRSPQEEGGGVEHALQGGQVVGPLAPLLHPEEHVLAQALELGQLLPQLLGGGGVAVLVHPFGRFPEFGRDLVFLLLRHNQLELLLVKLVLDKEERSGLLIKRGERDVP